jgi:hypothetical protein
MMALHMLTTIDNPHNPFTHYDEWAQFDQSSGYNTPEFLARLTITSSELSEADQDMAIELAIEEIVRENVNGMYKKVEAPSDWNSTEVA